ncbi:MAG TPA: DUF4159 domain-containing protein [Terriglobales bacterium]|jgi:hypothetical protein|nr:DUF4159 domain-containing protein [Terriglobales bacterium]
MSLKRVFFAGALLLGVVSVLWGQREDLELQQLCQDLASGRHPPSPAEFVFARLQFTSHGPGRGPYRRPTPCGPLEGWAHDYPVAEQHLLQLAGRYTRIHVDAGSYAIVRLDSRELFDHPFALMSEVGEMTLTDREVANLREYLNRGGFIVVDDFDSLNMLWFDEQMKKVFPDRSFRPLTIEHGIFHALNDIKSLKVESPYPQRGAPLFYGYFDDHGRLSMVLNVNNDLGDLWEWLDDPIYALAPSIEGVRLGINYLLYSFAH